jgi:hypothetical protein
MTILVIEDEQKTAHSLQQGLQQSGYEVDIAYDGQAGLDMALALPYQLIISDIVMPKMNGIELCKRLRSQLSRVPVLLLSALETKEQVIRGLDSGADDYITKPFDFGELLARVRVLTKRIDTTSLEAEWLYYADLSMNLKNKEVKRAGVNIELTQKEFKLLEYFMKRPNTTISRAELAMNIWNIDFNTGTNVVEVYINYLRNKVDRPFDSRLINNIHGIGYILKEKAS